MKQGKYDVVVIGSGMGGLCSAALLVKNGYKTLVVESLERVGGRFSTEEYEGFRLPTGGVGVQTRGVIQGIFEEVGAKFDIVDVSRHFIWIDGSWVELPEKGQVRFLLSLCGCDSVARDKIGAAFSDLRRNVPEEPMSFRTWLQQYTVNEKVFYAFQAVTSAISELNDFEYPVKHWAVYHSPKGQGGLTHLGHSRLGNRSNAENLAKTVKVNGSDVWVGAPAKQIKIKNGRVTGVVVEKNGKDVEVDARVVISNMGPKRTVQLAGRENFDAKHLKQVDALKEVPLIVTLVASDRPLGNVPGSVIPIGARRIVDGIPITNFCPAWAPKGQHLMVLWGTPVSCAHAMDVEREIELNIQDVKDIFPDFDKYGRILKMDVRNIDHEFPGYRAWPGYTMPQLTPILNLFHVGDAVMPFGWEGFAGCAQSARVAVNEIKKRFKPGA